jgi:hypothetical protein
VNRTFSALLLFFVLPAVVFAQAPSQDDLKKRRDKELQEPFLKNAPWFLEYDKALAEAKKTGKPVFAYFTRSFAD